MMVVEYLDYPTFITTLGHAPKILREPSIEEIRMKDTLEVSVQGQCPTTHLGSTPKYMTIYCYCHYPIAEAGEQDPV